MITYLLKKIKIKLSTYKIKTILLKIYLILIKKISNNFNRKYIRLIKRLIIKTLL